jgi:NAD(P)H-hydrate epimerase
VSLGAVVKSDVTVTFIGAKRGLFAAEGVNARGMLIFDNLNVPEEIYSKVGPSVNCESLNELLAELPVRRPADHKGKFGHVLVIGGGKGMGGAVLMAAQAAARLGAGLTSVATLSEHVSACLSRQPEVMVHAIDDVSVLEPLIEKATILVVGPGLGQTEWSRQVLSEVLGSNKPAVFDADALNLLAEMDVSAYKLNKGSVITPHPGEAARLLNLTTEQVQADRYASVQQLFDRYGVSALLKGAGSIMADAEGLSLCPYGNSGMASGGMGDVLSGMVAAFMAQGLAAPKALHLAVSLHARSADSLARKEGMIGILATDLISVARQLLNHKQ